MDALVPNEPAKNATMVQRETYETKKSDSNDVTCLMLATMVPELQKQFMDQEAYEIMVHLKGTSSSREIRDNKNAHLLQDEPGYASEYPRTKDERVFRYS